VSNTDLLTAVRNATIGRAVLVAASILSIRWNLQNSEQADSVLSQDFEVRGQTRILRCRVVEGGRERGTRHLLNEAKI